MIKSPGILGHRLRWLFTTEGALKARVLRGGIWLLLGNGAARAATLLKVTILARLLASDDFGLMGMGLVILGWLEAFTHAGMKDALIQRRGDIVPYLNTAWTVQILRGVSLAVLLFIGAPVGAWFFGNPGVTPIVRAIAILAVLRGLVSPAVIFLRKELDFYREVMWRLSGVGIGLAVAVSIALLYRNVWALALSVIAAQAAETLVSYWIAPFRPRVCLEQHRVRDLMRFGKWVFCWNLFGFLASNLDSIGVGKMLGVSALGYYQVAYQMAFLTLATIGTHVHGIMFPAFSRIQETRDRRIAFLRTTSLISSVVVPMGCFITVFAEPIVQLVLGARWGSISPTLRILAWAGVITALTATMSPLLQAANKPEIPARAMALRVLILTAILYPLVKNLGINGASLALLLSAIAEMAYQFLHVGRLIEISPRDLSATVRTGAFASFPFLIAAFLSPSSVSPSLFLIVASASITSFTVLAHNSLRQFKSSVPASTHTAG